MEESIGWFMKLSHSPPVQTFKRLMALSYQTLVVKPLFHLYLKGPSMGHFGFWQDSNPEDICSTLTNAPSQFWIDHTDECDALIWKKFQSILVLVDLVLYIFLIKYISEFLYNRYCRKPTSIVLIHVNENSDFKNKSQ